MSTEVILSPRLPTTGKIFFKSSTSKDSGEIPVDTFVIDIKPKKCSRCKKYRLPLPLNNKDSFLEDKNSHRTNKELQKFKNNFRQSRRDDADYNKRKIQRKNREKQTRDGKMDDERGACGKISLNDIFITRTSQMKLSLADKIAVDEKPEPYHMMDNISKMHNLMEKSTKEISSRENDQTKRRGHYFWDFLPPNPSRDSSYEDSKEAAPSNNRTSVRDFAFTGYPQEWKPRRSFSPIEKIRSSLRNILSQVRRERDQDDYNYTPVSLSEKSTQTETESKKESHPIETLSRRVTTVAKKDEMEPYECRSMTSSVIPSADYPAAKMIVFSPTFSNNFGANALDSTKYIQQLQNEVVMLRDQLEYQRAVKVPKKSLGKRLRKFFSREEVSSKEMINQGYEKDISAEESNFDLY